MKKKKEKRKREKGYNRKEMREISSFDQTLKVD